MQSDLQFPVRIRGNQRREILFAALIAPIAAIGIAVLVSVVVGANEDRFAAALIGGVLTLGGAGYLLWFITRAERWVDVFRDHTVHRHWLGSAIRPAATFTAVAVVQGVARVPKSSLEIPRWWIRLTDRQGHTIDIDPPGGTPADRSHPSDTIVRANARRLVELIAPASSDVRFLATPSRREAAFWDIVDDAGRPARIVLFDRPMAGRLAVALGPGPVFSGNSNARVITIVHDRLIAIDLAEGSVAHLHPTVGIDLARTSSLTLRLVDGTSQPINAALDAATPGWGDLPNPGLEVEALERALGVAIDLSESCGDRRWLALTLAGALQTAHEEARAVFSPEQPELDETQVGRLLPALLLDAGRALGEAGLSRCPGIGGPSDLGMDGRPQCPVCAKATATEVVANHSLVNPTGYCDGGTHAPRRVVETESGRWGWHGECIRCGETIPLTRPGLVMRHRATASIQSN